MPEHDAGSKPKAHGRSKHGLKEALDDAATKVAPGSVGQTFRVVEIEVEIANPRVGEYRVTIEQK